MAILFPQRLRYFHTYGSVPLVRNTTTYTSIVAANARAALARRDKSQRWLAEETGIKPATLHRRLRGNRRHAFLDWEVAAIAEALGVDITELMPPLAKDGEAA